MSEITLSKAVRSNLLNLQSTASLLGKSQERLSSGLRVNSALDNPTNFFTAQGLNSRASDLGQLSDAVSNAVQTVAAADKGITAITKLVESAQATARQALQTSATLASVPAVNAVATSGNTTSLTLVADVVGVTASSTSSNLTGVTISDGSAPVLASDTTGDLSALAATGGNFTINGHNVVVGAGDDETDVLAAIQTAATASSGATQFSVVDNGDDTFTLTAASGNNLTFGGNATTLTELGLTSATFTPGVTDTSGNVTINGQTIALAAGDNTAAIVGKFQAAATASSGANAFTVTNNAGVLTITGTNGNDLVVGGDANALTATGLSAGTVNGTTAVDNNAGSITINGQAIALAGGDNAAAILGKVQAAATASSGTNAFTVSNNAGVLTLTGTAGNDLVISGDASTLSAVGLSSGTVDGTPAVNSTPNPKRAELVATYNELLTQIDGLAKDASFNGVNLLNGDNLSVLFNEDGSSKLAITGVTNTSSGLGLTSLATTAFDTNSSINTTLDNLKGSIDTLRSQSAKFGSNLSVVETRQDFTKNMINVLQTGAANLTLADTNEEAANVLALQTRQQLSSTALSLASQADQNVLRLF